MSIWGRRDGEAPDEETHEGQAEPRESHAEVHDAQEPPAGHQAGEPAPAFWRAQGETPESLERDPADAPSPDFEHVPDDPPPAGVPTTMGPTPAVSEDPAGADARAPVLTGVIDAENAVKDPSGAEQPAVAPETAATGVQEPTVAVAREPVVNGAQETAATTAGRPTPAAIAAQRWSEILVAFVDDPRGSVKMAADAVDEAFGEFVKTVRLRQRDLASDWQSAGAGTEQLRTALREYRKLGERVRQLDLGEKTGA